MKKITVLILMAFVIAGCGSGSGTPAGFVGDPTRGAEITCVDLTAQGEACAGTLAASRYALWNSYGITPVVHNAGDVNFFQSILQAQAEVTNFGVVNAAIYYSTDYYIPGCTVNGNASSGSATYRRDILPGQTINSGSGIGSAPCTQAGFGEIVTYVYNATHLDYDTLGDPSTDELLGIGVVLFNSVL